MSIQDTVVRHVNASAISIHLSQKAKQNVALFCLYSPTVRGLGKEGTKSFYGKREYCKGKYRTLSFSPSYNAIVYRMSQVQCNKFL